MSCLNIKLSMHLTVKLSENNFYHHKCLCNSFSLNLVSFVRNIPPAISSLCQNVIEYISESTLFKVDMIHNEPITSAEELKLTNALDC